MRSLPGRIKIVYSLWMGETIRHKWNFLYIRRRNCNNIEIIKHDSTKYLYQRRFKEKFTTQERTIAEEYNFFGNGRKGKTLLVGQEHWRTDHEKEGITSKTNTRQRQHLITNIKSSTKQRSNKLQILNVGEKYERIEQYIVGTWSSVAWRTIGNLRKSRNSKHTFRV